MLNFKNRFYIENIESLDFRKGDVLTAMANVHTMLF